MATSIILQIKAAGTEQVITAINQIQQKANELSSKPITIKVNSSKISSLTQYTKAQAELVAAQNAVKVAELELAAATERRRQAEANTATATQKRATAEANTAAATERRVAAENNASAATERRRAAEANAAAAQERRRATEANQVNTANQAAAAESNATAASERRATAEANAAAAVERRATTESIVNAILNQGAAAENAATAATDSNTSAANTNTAANETDAAAVQQRALMMQLAIAAANGDTEAVARLTAQLNAGATTTRTFGSTLLATFGSRVLYAAISKLRQAIREAFSEMKEVDTQLTDIQKVTKASDEYMSSLREKAYSTASKYGVEASAYLESIATFSRAGYKEQAASLAEVAIKTQLVGDVSEETANQFLIAMDAAYDLGGSVEELSTILDQANDIDNGYATTIEKLADAMPIVASVASTAGITEQQLMSAIGTITATTQESGTTAARAFRAIILNIMGDTTTEIEDGVTWTSEQIQSLSDVLWTYSADAMNAAAATGEIVNPMEAIAGLAKAYEEGLLTDSKLMEISTKLGGKLRTNELISLVQNFDMYEDMLNNIADSAGSADNEVSVMLDSWESKANILKNSWTELMSTIANTDFIKGLLDDLTDIVDRFQALIDKKSGIKNAESSLTSAVDEYDSLVAKGEALTEWEQKRLEYLKSQTEELRAQVALENYNYWNKQLEKRRGLVGYSYDEKDANDYAVENMNARLANYSSQYASAQITLSQYKAKLQETLDLYQSAYDIYSGSSEAGISLTDKEKSYISAFEAVSDAMESANEIVTTSTEAAEVNTESIAEQTLEYSNLAETVEEASDAIERFNAAAETDQDKDLGDYAEAYTKMAEDITKGRLYSNTAMAGYELFLSPEQREALENDPKKMAAYVEQSEALIALMSGEGADAGANFANFLYNAADAAGELRDANGTLLASFTETDDGITYTIDDLDALADHYGLSSELLTAWAEAQGVFGAEMSDSTEDVMALAQSMGALTTNAEGVQTIDLDAFISGLKDAGKSKTEIGELVGELANVNGLDFAYATGELYNLIKSLRNAGEDVSVLQGMLDVFNATYDVKLSADSTDATSKLDQAQSKLEALTGKRWTITIGVGKIPQMAEGGTAKGGATLVNEEGPEIIKEGNTARIAGGGAPTITDLQPGATVYTADETKKILSGKSFKGVIRAAATGVRGTVGSGSGSGSGSGGAKASSSSSGDTDYWEELEEAVEAKLEEAEKARDAELDDLEKQIDALKEAKETEEDRLELEEKILAVQEAQTKLANAQAERTVRMYNAATGQWEWIANQKDVQSAQESLKKAQDALDEYKADKAYDEAVAAIEAQKDLVNERYDALESEWKGILESIEEPLREIADILKDVSRTGTDRQKNATSSVQTLASLIATFIAENPSGWTLPGYDSGGVLSGLGGIKATRQDEIVLGPELSAKILSPTPNAQFDAFTKALGAVYGVPNATIPSATANAYGASTDSHDTVYSFPGGIHLTEAQANSTTLGDLARQLRILNLT